MTTILGPVAKNQSAAYPGSAGDLVVNRFEMLIPAGTSTVDIYEIGSLPPNCRIIDAILDSPVSLGAAGAVANVAIMTGIAGDATTPRTLVVGSELFSGAAVSAAAPGAVTRMSAATGFRIAPTPVERGIGLQFTTRATGTAGLIALTVFCATT